jgi:hypothetical protein
LVKQQRKKLENVMADDLRETKHWWQSLPALMTATAALITAITGLYVTMCNNKVDPCSLPLLERPIDCVGKNK